MYMYLCMPFIPVCFWEMEESFCQKTRLLKYWNTGLIIKYGLHIFMTWFNFSRIFSSHFCVPQTAVCTASWPACFASFSCCATSCWTVQHVARAPLMTRASAAVAHRKNAATVSFPVTWTAASSTPVASQLTVWRSAWSAAASASHPERPIGGTALFVQNF